MHKPLLNPFIYPGPVPVESFIGREGEVHLLLSRIATGQSTAVVGEPYIGKSSLLGYLAECEDCHSRLGEKAAKTLFFSQDCHLLPGSFTPPSFWRQVLAHVWDACPDEQVRQVIDWAATKGEFGSYALERVFQVVTRRGWCVVLLIDEFDSLLHHAGFNTAEFFGALRSLATRFAGLVLVTASRLSVAEMNRQSEELNPFGSPFFNGFIEVNLRPFDDDDVNALLKQALAGTGVNFDVRDCEFLYAMAGRHPFLFQAAAGALYDAIVAGRQGDDRYHQAGRTYYRQTEAHFADLWRHLDPLSRAAVTILCLAELQGQVPGQSFRMGDIGSLDRFTEELSSLAERGLVALGGKGGQRWRVASRRLVWWVSDQVLARDEVDWEEWLDAKRYRGLLTTEEMETLQSWAKRIPKSAINTATKVIGLLLKELLAATV